MAVLRPRGQAPRPMEIYWENFGLGRLEKATHYAESVAATFGAFVLFVAVCWRPLRWRPLTLSRRCCTFCT